LAGVRVDISDIETVRRSLAEFTCHESDGSYFLIYIQCSGFVGALYVNAAVPGIRHTPVAIGNAVMLAHVDLSIPPDDGTAAVKVCPRLPLNTAKRGGYRMGHARAWSPKRRIVDIELNGG
jgi:hypothetical protein